MGLQLQTSKRLTRSLQEVTAGAQDEVAAVAGLVNEVVEYSSSHEALDWRNIDEKFVGRKALEEATCTATC